MDSIATASKSGLGYKIAVVGLFLALGALIMIVFSPWNPLQKPVNDLFGRIGLTILLVIAGWLCGKFAKLTPLRPVINALTIMIVAVSLMWIMANYLIDNLGLTSSNPRDFALLKLSDMIIVFLIVIGLSRVMGFTLQDLYLQNGRVRLGLLLGLGTFTLAAATAVPSGIWLFKLDPEKLAGWQTWMPWLVVFVLANGAMEELLFRGLFLKKFEPLLGDFGANLTIALVFTALHFGVGYTSDQWLFMGILIGLALLFGTVIQKTKALWPAILFHAGMDISVMLGIFSNLH
jgi:membrane protease YdiL (CAAX protease family)